MLVCSFVRSYAGRSNGTFEVISVGKGEVTFKAVRQTTIYSVKISAGAQSYTFTGFFSPMGAGIPITSRYTGVSFVPEEVTFLTSRSATPMVYNVAKDSWDNETTQTADASLKSLTVNQGTLKPTFSPSVTSYTVSVGNSVTSITISATANSSSATVTGTGNKSLTVGQNTFNIKVTDGSGSDQKTMTYKIVVTRELPPDASLKSLTVSQGTLKPTFSPTVTSYTVSVSNSVTSLKIAATAKSSSATVTGTGSKTLNVGQNKFTIKVTDGSGADQQTMTYTIVVTRESPTVTYDASLKSLTVSQGTLKPTFSPTVTSYTVSVGNNVTSITISATANSSTATVTGTGSKSLNVGQNTFNIKVTDGSGADQKTMTYTIVVTQESFPDADIQWELSSDGVLTISGKGKMPDYTSENSPWYAQILKIKKIVIEDGISSIGNYAFYNCYRFTEISIPESVTAIGDYAFKSCDYLISVKLSQNILSIGQHAFENCINMTSITVPKSVINIGDNAFGTTWLDRKTKFTEIIVEEDNPVFKSVDGILFNKDMTTLICYPANKEGKYIIPNSVSCLYRSSFNRCNKLTDITIPNTVKEIGYGVFSVCTGLVSITVSWSDPSSISYGNSSSYLFYYVTTSKIKLHIPSGTENEYSSHSIWKQFILTTTSNDPIKSEIVRLVPNPASDFVKISGVTSGTTVQIYDTSGRIVMYYNVISENETLPISTLPTGMYFVRTNKETLKLIKR